jgi:hypothetical protein
MLGMWERPSFLSTPSGGHCKTERYHVIRTATQRHLDSVSVGVGIRIGAETCPMRSMPAEIRRALRRPEFPLLTNNSPLLGYAAESCT